jgi:uncharacterized protein (TIGR02757 family)
MTMPIDSTVPAVDRSMRTSIPVMPRPSPQRIRRLCSLRTRLDSLYHHYSRTAYLSSDPLGLVLPYGLLEDREIVAYFAAGLAYGNVRSIRNSLMDLLGRLGPAPAALVDDASPDDLRELLHGFQHRWTRADEVTAVLLAMKRMRQEWGSLGRAFRDGYHPAHGTVLPALTTWTRRLRRPDGAKNSLVADLDAGSACKRLCLFLRWMVRQDAVDPGGWEDISPAQLVVPIDVHMFRVARQLQLTRRRTVNLQTALAVTEAFRVICAEDPLRYDFALTRPGILRQKVIGPDA